MRHPKLEWASVTRKQMRLLHEHKLVQKYDQSNDIGEDVINTTNQKKYEATSHGMLLGKPSRISGCIHPSIIDAGRSQCVRILTYMQNVTRSRLLLH